MNRILIIKLGSIGDVVHTFPALSDLRASFPRARIDWLVERQAGVLLRNYTWLDQVIEVDTRKWRRALWQPQTWREIYHCLSRLRERRYEVAFDFQGLWKSAVFGLFSGSRLLVGFDKAYLKEPSCRILYGQRVSPDPATRHVSEFHRALVGSQGATRGQERFELAAEEPDRAYIDARLAEHRLDEFIILNPGGGWVTKNWSPANYGLLHQRIRRELGLTTVLTWGPGEEDLVREVMAACSGDPPLDLFDHPAPVHRPGPAGPPVRGGRHRTPAPGRGLPDAGGGDLRPDRPPQERAPAPGRPGGFPAGSLRALLQEDLPEVPAPVHDPGHGRSSVRCGREAAGADPPPSSGPTEQEPLMMSRLTRIRVPAGFLLAGLYFYLAHPTWPLWPVGTGVALLGILFRAWAAGHVRKNDQLAVSGPYAFTRHPLYLGSFVIGLGFSLAGRSLPMLILFLACFFFLYGPAMRAEEERLKQLFPHRYPDYQRNVPFFLPTRWPDSCSPDLFSLERYRRNREYRVVLGFACALGVLLL